MTVERRERGSLVVLGGTEADNERAIERDFQIRSGLCPNGHGLMDPTSYGQRCPSCGFFTNTAAEASSHAS